MSHLPPRTGRTNLTDDQLLLFDFLFNHWVPFGALCRTDYLVHMNVGYTHTLDDDHLARTLNELHASGLITTHPAEHLAYGLTAKGGQLWEVERQPDWDAYCTDISDFGEGYVTGFVTVHAPVLATAEAFLRTAQECGLYICDLNQRNVIRHQAGEISSVIPWKTFAEEYAIQATLQPGHVFSRDQDWECYERQRTWWRTIHELTTFHSHKRQ